MRWWSGRGGRWSRRAGRPARVEAQALLGLGLGWQGRRPYPAAGRRRRTRWSPGPAACSPSKPMTPTARRAVACAVHEPRGWVRCGSRCGRTCGWRGRSSRSGAWDEAAAAAERAVSLLEESGHEWLRPLARFAAVLVPAARGEWVAAEEHAGAAVARSGDYELMVVAAGLAQAQVPAARGDHEGVLRALEPVVGLIERVGVDEPGFWPWQDLYADALVSAGRLAEAEVFLVPHEELAGRGGGDRWWRGWRGCGGGWRRRGGGCRRRRRRSVGR